MGEIANQGHAPNGPRRVKKLSTRVDLTPMVDLGFLLITFFVFTSAMSKPTVLPLANPVDDTNNPTPYRESTILTAIPISGNKVFYYHGKLEDAISENQYGVTSFSMNDGIGEIIRRKQKAVDASPKFDKDDTSVIIKAGEESTYKNLVDMLDEMLINKVKHYMMIDVTNEEIEVMKKLNIR